MSTLYGEVGDWVISFYGPLYNSIPNAISQAGQLAVDVINAFKNRNAATQIAYTKSNTSSPQTPVNLSPSPTGPVSSNSNGSKSVFC